MRAGNHCSKAWPPLLLAARVLACLAVLVLCPVAPAEEPRRAGVLSPGTTDYPNGGMLALEPRGLSPTSAGLLHIASDGAHAYAIAGHRSRIPGILKIELGPDVEAHRRVGSLGLLNDERWIQSAAFDTENGYAYLGIRPSSGGPARIVKIALGDEGEAPRRVGSITMEAGEIDANAAVVDPDNGYIYFAVSNRLVKLEMGEGDTLPRRIGAIAIGRGSFHAAVIDQKNGFGYFGSEVGGHIAKVDLGEGDSMPRVVSGFVLEEEEMVLFRDAFLDPRGGYAYFTGHGIGPGRPIRATFLKVALGAGDASPYEVGRIILGREEAAILGVVDQQRRHAYTIAGTRRSWGELMLVTLGDGDSPPDVIASWEMGPDLPLGAMTREDHDGHALFLTIGSPIGLGSFPLAGAETSPSVSTVSPLGDERHHVSTSVLDHGDGYVYLGTTAEHGSAQVVKVELNYPVEEPRLAGSLLLHENVRALENAVIDTETGDLVFCVPATRSDFDEDEERECHLMLVAVSRGDGSEPPRRVDEPASREAKCIGPHADSSADPAPPANRAQDPNTGIVYFSTYDGPPGIIKAVPGDGQAGDREVGLLPLPGEVVPSGVLPGVLHAFDGFGYYFPVDPPFRVFPFALGHKGTLRATKVRLPEAGDIEDVRLYSHVAEGHVRLAVYREVAGGISLAWQSDQIRNTAEGDELVVPISDGTPSSLSLRRGTYWVAWQADTQAPVASYSKGEDGDGFVIPHEFGPAPRVPAYERPIIYTNERWTTSLTYTSSQ